MRQTVIELGKYIYCESELVFPILSKIVFSEKFVHSFDILVLALILCAKIEK